MSAERRVIPYDYVKRGLDLVGASVAFIISLPVQGVVAIAVARKLGRPVLFKQQRPGRDGKIFMLIKFRTMKDIDLERGLVTDEQRLTRFGEVLRSSSLDELPSLWNALRGDMSFVGPRPLLVEYLDRYTPEQARRHEVRPGITGLAQVSGRNALTWEQKFRFDVLYVDRRGLGVDVGILLRTVSRVFAREGITHEGHATMQKFGGQDAS
ncbi:sugar transferase [Glaciibacter superstes]|uniref:sugar transferase n=1 Tax=Glaciibacter superstes TaxID=501023 RepID=UPI0003B3F734|nr:sugar transferase [Glaciibacter superstes]